ncbi:hypothetical protein [Nostoc sp. DSM 114161]|uniref:hypothetical protein n=1 Tax=Nostoc sp. DSM 114161 TaxID=3440143 RepID=UPI00404572C0
MNKRQHRHHNHRASSLEKTLVRLDIKCLKNCSSLMAFGGFDYKPWCSVQIFWQDIYS